MKQSDANALDRALVQWIKAKHAEIDNQLGIRLAEKGFHVDMIKNKAIDLIFRTVDSKKGDTKIIRYFVKRMDNSEIKLMEVQISLSSIRVV